MTTTTTTEKHAIIIDKQAVFRTIDEINALISLYETQVCAIDYIQIELGQLLKASVLDKHALQQLHNKLYKAV